MLANVQQTTIKPIITATVTPGTLVHTDEYGIYARLPAWGYRHKTVCHGRGEYARDEDGDGFCEVHVNTIEGFWSLLRSWLRPHRGISQDKLPDYLGGSCRVPGCWLGSSDECGDKGAKQGFAASARVVHELKEAEVKRQLVLRDAPVRSQPRAQQRPKPFHRVDVDLAEAVAILITGVFAAPVTDRLMSVAPDRQAGIDAILVRVDEGAGGDSGGDNRLDRGLLHVGQHAQHDLATALDQAEDGRLVLRQRAPSRRACQPATAPEPPLLATAAGWPLCPATT